MVLYFSDFAKLLFPHCRAKDSKNQFVITLTNNMLPRPGISNKDGDYNNPMLNITPTYRGRFFSGERKIPLKVIGVISGNQNKYRFEEFITNGFSDDTKANLASDIEKLGIPEVNRDNVGAVCADIFAEILVYGKYEIESTDIT